ncbi:DUF5702 domain-containing protein, partial [Clostridium sp.]
MIYAMKYQGTENLLLGVFDKIKEFTNSKEVIEESEKLQEADEKVQAIDDEIEDMQNAKLQASEALIELAKNNNYKILEDSHIGYITNIEDIKALYPGNDSIAAAYDSMKSYISDTRLPKVYSYAYTILILTMYKEYLSILVDEQEDQGNSEFRDSINGYEIDQLIVELEELIRNETNQLGIKLDGYSKNLENGIKKVDYLINNYDSKVKPILDIYKDSADNAKNEDIKKNSQEAYKNYNELFSKENLQNVKNDFMNIKKKVDYVASSLNSLVEKLVRIKTDYSGLIPTDWVINNKDNNTFQEMDRLIGKKFKKPADTNNFVEKICKNEVFITLSKKTDILSIQIETINEGESISNATKMKKPTDDGTYKKFYKMFKDLINEKQDESKINIQGKSKDKSFQPVIPSDNSSNASKLSQQLEEIDNNYNLDLSTTIISGGGAFLDKLYLVEYVMTNFKDRSPEFETLDVGNKNYKRIPEITDFDSNTLEYEIEAIISGQYNDKESSTTLVDDFILMRMTLNTISLISYQEQIKTFINSISPIISAATGGVLPIPLVKSAIILGWASFETSYDIIDIFNGYSVPVIKKNFDDWVSNFGLDIDEFGENESLVTSFNKDYDATKKDGAYNNQDNDFSLNYTDMMRFKLLIIEADKIIDGSQNIIVENKNLQGNYKNYKSNIEVNVEKSKLNILFNTDVFSSEEGHKFNSFTFKKGYN